MSHERIIEVPTLIDKRGNLSFIETGNHIPFAIGSASWIYNMPTDFIQKGCTSKQEQQLIVALSGNLDVVLKEGNEERIYALNSPNSGLYIASAASYALAHFSDNAVCLILNSSIDTNKLDQSDLSTYTVNDCRLVELPTTKSTTHAKGLDAIPFAIQRVFYIYDIPNNEKRGMHAHTYCHEMLIAINGVLDVTVDDGLNRKSITLDNPIYGLHIPPGIWASQQYTANTVCLALASHKYDAEGYINTYSNFINYRLGGSTTI